MYKIISLNLLIKKMFWRAGPKSLRGQEPEKCNDPVDRNEAGKRRCTRPQKHFLGTYIQKDYLNHSRYIIFLILVLLFFPNKNYANWNQAQLFPNKFQHVEPELIEKAMISIASRMSGRYTSENGKVIKAGPIFSELTARINKQDSNAIVYLDGSTTQSVLGYIYTKLQNSNNPTEILNKLVNDQYLIPINDIIESHGRINVVIHQPPPIPPKETNIDLNPIATDFLNQTINFNPSSKSKPNQFHLFGAVHTEQSLSHTPKTAATSLDLLLLPIRSSDKLSQQGTTHSVSNILNELVNSHYDCIKDGTELQAENITRCLTPLLENPYLELSPADSNKIIKILKENKIEPSIQAFEELANKARFGFAHNRFKRAQGELYETIQNWIGQRTRVVKEKINRFDKEITMPLIPTTLNPYALSRPQDPNAISLDNLGSSEKKIIVPYKQYIENYSARGKIFHGTPHISNLTQIKRNGLIPSDELNGQGRSLFGYGFTPHTNSLQQCPTASPLNSHYLLQTHIQCQEYSTGIMPSKMKNS